MNSPELDLKMMRLALNEARKGRGRTSPNPMVGAVVVKKGEIVAKGWHKQAGAPHAEREALDRAGEKARGAELYVTLEPCNHHGRTPPCTERILAAGVSRVVIGAPDPNPHVTGGGARRLKEAGIEVTAGVLEKDCQRLNEFFNHFITTGLPFVILKSAATLDGKTATASGHSRWVTSQEARKLVHWLRNDVDAICVGRATVEADDPALTCRLPGRRKGRQPLRVVLDTHLGLSPDSRVFDPALGAPALAACGEGVSQARRSAFEAAGVRVLALPLVKGRVSLAALVARLGRMGIMSLLIEGGAGVAWSALMEERVVNRLLYFFAPKIAGGRTSPPLVGGPGVMRMDQALNLDVEKIQRAGPDFLVQARPLY